MRSIFNRGQEFRSNPQCLRVLCERQTRPFQGRYPSALFKGWLTCRYPKRLRAIMVFSISLVPS